MIRVVLDDAVQQLVITGMYDSGQTRDFTRKTTYQAEPAGIVKVDETGLILPIAEGKAVVKALAAPGIEAAINVQVTNLVLYWLAWDKLAVSPWRAYWPSWPLAALVALTVGVIEHVRPVTGVATLLAYGTAAIVGYGAILWFVFPRHTRAWVHLIRRRTY